MAYVFRTGDLPKLDIDTDRGTDFNAWHQQWLAYRSLSGLSGESPAKQVQALQLCFSRETLKIVDNLGLTNAQKKDQAQTIAALKSYVDGQVNESIERRNLRQRAQHVGETFDDYLVSLRELAKTCNFCNNDCLQKAIRDQIIEGLQDGEIIQELLQVKDLTLEQAISKCRALESAKKSRQHIQPTPAINAVRPPPPTNPTKTCPGCGSNLHVGGRKSCPAFNQTCRNCGKVGHFGRVCRQKLMTKPIPQTNPPQTGSLSIPPDHSSQATLSNLGNAPFVPAPRINILATTPYGQAYVEVLPDSGADICAAGPLFVQTLGECLDNLAHSDITPRAINGTVLHPIGKIPKVTFCLQGRKVKKDVHIYPSISGAIISWDTAQTLGILPSCYPKPHENSTVCQTRLSTPQGRTPTAEELMAEFPKVFDGQVRTMPGEKFHISLTKEAKPFCVSTPRTIPFAYREKLKEEIDLLVDQGIITPVTEPTEWCAPIVVAPKKGTDRIRMCVDLSKLNKYVRREHYPSITPQDAVADIQASSAKYFTVFDALKGYHQCPLDEVSQRLTTFITPFGRYMYRRAPYGISSISEHYNRRMDEAFQGITSIRKIVDDVIVYDQDKQQHIDHVREILRRCTEKGISLNRDKFQLCRTEVRFAGLQLTQTGYSVSDEITAAIANFPTPTSRTDLRSFCGLVNQLASSTNSVSNVLAPLRPLLSSRNDFLWTPVHDEAFLKAKQALTTAPTLAYFDPTKDTRLYTDASRLGLGFLLMQKSQQNESEWKLVQAGSRFLTDAETRYAVIELECLAVTWAIKKCHIFLAGIDHFTVITDHNPLIPILNTHRLDEIENPRLQRLRTRIMAYRFTTQWEKGSQHEAADALSRFPHSAPNSNDELAEQDMDAGETTQAMSFAQIRSSTQHDPDHENLHLQELRQHAQRDTEYQALKETILRGFPSTKADLPESLKRFWGIKDHLSIDDDLIVYGCRLFIPCSLRPTILSRLHEAHQGISRSQARARLTLYWPNIDQDIEHFVQGCRPCQDRLPSQTKEPMLTKPPPQRPFQQIAVDFASFGGRNFLIIVDCKTDWPDIIEVGKDMTATKLSASLRDHFCRTAVPDLMWSDGGPQFTSQHLTSFLHTWGVSHEMSSPHYPQSNGKAESAVKSMKKLISASWTGHSVNWNKLSRALLQYRNTPCRKDGLSPAQKLYGHPIQDTLPAHRRSFAPEWQKSSIEADKKAQKTHENSTRIYNQQAHTLPELEVGNHVAIQNPTTKLWDTYGTVTNIGPYRKYFVKTQSGTVFIRNRRFIRKRRPISITSPTPVPTEDTPNPPCTPPSSLKRRSTRVTQRPSYLSEDTGWISSSYAHPPQELGGEV